MMRSRYQCRLRVPACAAVLGLFLLALPATTSAVLRTCGVDPVANTQNVLCASPSGPCNASSVTLGADIEVTDAGCDFDLGGRTFNVQKKFQMTGLGFIRVTNAGNITLTGTGKLEARGDFVQPSGFIIHGGLILLTSSGTITMLDRALIDVSGDGAGTIALTATGADGSGVGIDLQSGSVLSGLGISSNVDTGDRYADGGILDLTATTGSIVDNASIAMRGANGAVGGEVGMQAARDISVGEVIDATGGAGDGGTVDLTCGDNITITKTINADSRLGGGYGGVITLEAGVDLVGGVVAGGSLTVNDTTLELNGSDAETFGGDGGELEASALGALRIIGSRAAIRANGGTLFDGSGGAVFLDSGDTNTFVQEPLDGDLVIEGQVVMRSGGLGGYGGVVEASAGRALTLKASVTLTGRDSGGDLIADAGGAILLNGTINAGATNTAGDSGYIEFTAGVAQDAQLTVARDILAAGGESSGSGQTISLAACGLTVNDGVKVDGHGGVSATGAQGGSDIELIARKPMQLRSNSQYLAYPAGRITTIHPPGQNPVIGTGVVFNPGWTDSATNTGPYPNCPVCGDGVKQLGEGCDDGDLANGDGCSASCTVESGWTCSGQPSACVPTCGDGFTVGGEQCDDGNLVSGDGCDANCKPTACGNGIITAGEQCDDGNLVSGDGCGASCAVELGWSCSGQPSVCSGNCGDGIQTGSEECDDGNLISGDGCDANCTPTGCGNFIVTAGEDCDDGNTLGGDCCSASCQFESSGSACTSDGNVCTNDLCNGGGVCQHVNNTAPCASDGNVCTDDVCSAGTCTHVNNTAPCNDGNACTRTDTCQAGTCTGANPVVCTALDQCHVAGTCAPATGVCSNPNKADGSTCNDGNACTQTDTCQAGTCTGANPVVCTALDQCHVAGTCAPATGVCTNPFQPNGTSCNDGDGCTITDECTNGTCVGNPMICGDGTVQETCGELCDDGNLTDSDGCDSNCTPTGCGNGILTVGEECDDGDLADGDGCSASCAIEPGWLCTAQPSVCTEVCGDTIVTPGEECDDGNTVSRDGCSSTCKLELCGAAPATGCRRPVISAKAAIVLKDKEFSERDLLVWKWIKGAATTKSDFGNPLFSQSFGGTSYALCVYDDNGGTPRLKMSVGLPAGGTCRSKSCWRDKTKGFTYSDKDLTPDGAAKLTLKEGLEAEAKITFKGKGLSLLMPDLSALVQPVVVQLRNSDGLCWEAVYSAPPTKQTIDQFKDKAD